MSPARRLAALAIGVISLLVLAWCVQRLQAAGAPTVPPAVLQLLERLPRQLLDVGSAVQHGALRGVALTRAMVIGLLQVAVLILALVTALSLLVALRRPRTDQHRRARVIRTAQPPPPLPGPFRARRCASCGLPAQADWRACPRCATTLPAARGS